MRYVHVIRDGVVMSQSDNWSQAALWGRRFNLVKATRFAPPTPATKFSYWVRANEAALLEAERSLPGRYYIVRYEDCATSQSMCSTP